MTAVEWLEEELKSNLKKVILECDSELMESLFEQAKEMEEKQMIKFANWLDKLTPSQRVSVWSKDGSASGLFTMDNEQLFEQFKKVTK